LAHTDDTVLYSIDSVLYKHLNHETTEAEERRLYAWLEEREEHRTFYFEIAAIWSAHKTLSSKQLGERCDAMMRRLNARIDADEAMRREVIRQLRSVRRSNRALEKGVRAIVYRKTAGFRVTVGTSGRGPGAKGYYWSKGNRREVPVLCWTDTGTDMRFTRGTARRSAHHTGRLDPPGMIIDNAVRAKGDEVTRDVMDGIERSCLRAAMRYGCR